MMIVKRLVKFRMRTLFLCSQNIDKDKQAQKNNNGTEYTNWILTRASGHNHSVSHMKRKQVKDRYSIHRLTNLSFMCTIIKQPHKYILTLNQKIVLLAHMAHVIKVVGKDMRDYQFYMGRLLGIIFAQIDDPPDLVCIGTLMSSLISMNYFNEGGWFKLVEEILRNKFDEDYDELFGIIVGLNKYKQHTIILYNEYSVISADEAIPKIPIIYRNSLDVLRQFITQNIYNLKQCRLLFEALYSANINQRFFWNSVRDWFNIYAKSQLSTKNMDEYFIMKQSAIEKVLHDHGIIRPRPILQELSSIVFILSQFDNISWRFIQFAQDLIIYAISNGSQLFKQYQKIAAQQQVYFASAPALNINQHFKTQNEKQKQNIKQMQKRYRTVFINPINLSNNFIVYFLVVLSRAYKKYEWPQNKKSDDDRQTNIYDMKNEIVLDLKVKRWLIMQLTKPEMLYTVKQLLMINRCQQFLADFKINMMQFILQKLQNLRYTNVTYDQLLELMNLVGKYNYGRLNEVFSDFLFRNHPSQIHKLTKLTQSRQQFPYMCYYMLRLPKSVNKHEKYFSFEQNCYFMLMLVQNSQGINMVECAPHLKLQHDNQMELLREYLKIITYNRGFKLTVNSYFHKLLDYIDPVQFFQGGRG